MLVACLAEAEYKTQNKTKRGVKIWTHWKTKGKTDFGEKCGRLIPSKGLFIWRRLPQHFPVSPGTGNSLNRVSFFFVKEPENVAVVTGKNASFHCKANAAHDKVITYFWKFNGSLIYADNSNGFHAASESLYIYNVDGAKHNGAYECIAFTKDLGAIKSRTAKLQTAYFFRISNPRRTDRADVPKPYIIKLPKYKAFPRPTYTWVYLSKEIVDTFVNITKSEMYETLEGDLLIFAVMHSITTHYRCFVYHPTIENTYADKRWFRLNRGEEPSICENTSMTSMPTKTNKTVAEGGSVTFDCLAVAVACFGPITVRWTRRGQDLNETTRRLVLTNVTKKTHEGKYECRAVLVQHGTTINITYVLDVLERPVIVKAVSPKVNLPANGILYPAVVNKAKSLTWYKDGHVINSKSPSFQVFPNGNLRIKNPSPAFDGIYQILYQNQAGVTTVSQKVNINSKGTV